MGDPELRALWQGALRTSLPASREPLSQLTPASFLSQKVLTSSITKCPLLTCNPLPLAPLPSASQPSFCFTLAQSLQPTSVHTLPQQCPHAGSFQSHSGPQGTVLPQPLASFSNILFPWPSSPPYSPQVSSHLYGCPYILCPNLKRWLLVVPAKSSLLILIHGFGLQSVT